MTIRSYFGFQTFQGATAYAEKVMKLQYWYVYQSDNDYLFYIVPN